MDDFDILLNEQLKDEEFRREYEAMKPKFAIIQAMIDTRVKTGFTQEDLSSRSGVSQRVIRTLENGNGNPSLETLQKLAEAMNMTLKLEFIPK